MQEQSSMKSKTVKGLLWSFTDLMANQGIQFIILIILARILLPEHFGIIGMILVFIAISNSIIDSGFTQALIREQNASQDDYSTIFYFNLLIGVGMYAVLFASAPLISDFFNEPQLINILRVFALSLIINSFGIVQRARLIKSINFKTLTKINIAAGLFSGITAVTFAVLGFGVWSLVVQVLAMQFLQTVLLWFANRWKPSLVFNVESFKRMFGFGSRLMISGLIDTIYKNIYFVIIGRLHTPAQLGYYTNAVRMRDVASQSITSALQRVTYPVLSSIQNEDVRLKYAFKKVIRTSAFLMFPFMIGLAAIAEPLVHVVFGEKWLPMVVLFQLLCLAGMLYPLHAINLNILQVKGRSDVYLLLEIIKKTILTILIVLAVWLELGIIGLIGAAVLSSYISLFINIYFAAKEISYSVFEQCKDLIPAYVTSMAMWGIIYVSGTLLSTGNIIKLILQIIIGVLVYAIMSKILRIPELQTVIDIIMPLYRKVLKRSQ